MLRYLLLLLTLSLLSCCQRQNSSKELNDLNGLKQEFLEAVLESSTDEGPFNLTYELRTVLLSDEIVSLFGKFSEYVHLPHSWGRYEGKTYCKIGGQFKELTLDDLFKTNEQKEFLRNYCEQYAKNHHFDYFSGDDPLHTTLKLKSITTFVVDEAHLRIIFQPYVVGSYVEGPFTIAIPYDHLEGQWDPDRLLIPLLEKIHVSKDYISSWDKKEYFRRIGEG